MTLKDRLKDSRKKAKKTQAEVAEAVKMSQPAYQALETGRNLKSAYLPMIAQFLGVDPFWLTTGTTLNVPNSDLINDSTGFENNIDLKEKISLKGRPVPVITWDQAINWSGVNNMQENEIIEWLPPSIDNGESGYALIVNGLSMSPKFESGDYIYINPDLQNIELKTGDLVIAYYEERNEALFRQLIIEGTTYFIQPLNKQWPEQILQLTNNSRVLGKVLGLYRKV